MIRLRYMLTILLSFLVLAACTKEGGNSPGTSTNQQLPTLTLVIDGPGRVLVRDTAICSEQNSPCKFKMPQGDQARLSIFPTENVSFYSWSNCSNLEGTICHYTSGGDLTVTAHFVDPRPPNIPLVSLSDPTSGSTVETYSQVAKLSILNDSRASYWCVFEKAFNDPAPVAPASSHPCWVSVRPTSQVLGALGQRKVYVYTRTYSGTVSTGPGIASITYKTLLPVLSIAGNSGSGTGSTSAEGDNLTFIVTLSKPSDQAITFNYSTSDGSAISGVNYVPVTGSVTIQPGQVSAEIIVNTIHNPIQQENKTFTISLSNVSGAAVETSIAQGTIIDTDSGPVLSLQASTAKEGEPLVFTVTQSAISEFNTTFSFHTEDGSGVDGINYSSTAGTVTIPAGQTNGTFQVDTIDDGIYTPNKTVLAFISNPTNATIATDRNLGIINNNNSAPSVSISTASVIEGEAFVVTIQQSKVTGFDTTIRYSTSDLTAVSGVNYNYKNGSVVIPAGQTSATFNIQSIDAGIYAPDKELSINLTSAANATVATPSISSTIKNNHIPPNVSIASTSTKKGDPLVFTVIQNSRSGYDTTIQYQTIDGTAVAGTDYVAKTGTVTIPKGSESATISIPTIDNGVFSLPKTMSVQLSQPSRANLGVTLGIGSIKNETGPTLSISDLTIDEGQPANFVVTLSSALPNDVNVDFSTTNGTAISGRNFTTKVGTLTIPAGQTSATISVSTLKDNFYSLPLTFDVMLVGSPNAIILKKNGTATLNNLDSRPSITIQAASAKAGDPLSFTVNQSAVSLATTSLTFDLVDDTAITNLNYKVPSFNTVSILPGQISTTIQVETISSGFIEDFRTFKLHVQGTENATLVDPVALGTILNNNITPSVTIANAQSLEGNALTFKVSLSNISISDVSVNVKTSNGSAVSGVNYVSTDSVVTIPAGHIETTFVVPTIDSGVAANDTQMLAILSSPVNATLGRSSAIGTIVNNHGLPKLYVPSSTIAEEGENLEFIVTQSAPRSTETSFKYRTIDGTATAPKNYISSTGTAVIPPGETSVTINVPTVDDNRYYISRTMTFQILDQTNATIAKPTGIGEIRNIDPMPTLHLAEVSVNEGETINFIAQLSAPSDLVSSFTFKTIDLTAIAGVNYTNASGALTIPVGQTSKAFTVSTIDDHTFMPTLKVGVSFSQGSNVDLSVPPGNGLIKNIDPPPTLSIATSSANQGSEIQFTVTQSNVSGFDSTFSYSTSDGTAIANQHYLARTGSGTILAGQKTATFSVPTIDQGVFAPVRAFNVSISAPTNAIIEQGVATGTILNNHEAPKITVSDAETIEGDELIFTATQSVVSALDSKFDFATVDGTGEAGINYIPVTGTVVIPAGQQSATFSVTTIRDGVNTPTKTVTLLFSNPVNSNLENQSSIGSIENGDAEPNLTVADVTVDEGQPLVFTITASSVYVNPITVEYSTEDVSAESPSDYTPVSGTVIIPSGQKNVTVTVPTIQDGFYSLSKTLNFKLSNSTNSTILRENAVGIIRNIDPLPKLKVSNAETIDGQPFTFTITQDHLSKVDSSVTYETLDGTAKTPAAYNYAKGTVIIPAGQTSTTFSFFSVDQGMYGNDLLMSVVLSDPANAEVEIGTGSGTIHNHYPPPAPNMAISDKITGSRTLTNKRTVKVDIDLSIYAVRWCLTESILSKPLDANSVCLSNATGPNVSNGWFTSIPTEFTIQTPGDGLHTIYLWIYDGAGRISDEKTASITLDTQLPPTPSITLSSPTTGSQTLTAKSTVNVSIANDEAATGYCLIEKAESDPAPESPVVTDPCWSSVKPATFQLSDLGSRLVYVFVKNLAQNISAPGSASIVYDATPPETPTLVLSDSTTNNNLYLRQKTAKVSISNDTKAIKWCLSESQIVRPLSDSFACLGGQGDENGWSQVRPEEFEVSDIDGVKTIYLWVSDADGNINLLSAIKNITLDTEIPTPNSITLRDSNSGSTSDTNQNTVIVEMSDHSKSRFWILIEAGSEDVLPPVPNFDDSRWTSTRPTSLTLSTEGLRKAILFTRSLADNVSSGIESASMNYSTLAPNLPSLSLIDSATGNSTSVTGRRLVNLSIQSPDAYRWCVSEIQNTAPALGSSTCNGGQGPSNGWFTSLPEQFTLSDSDGSKTVYLWVSGANNTVNQAPVSEQITLDRTIPGVPFAVLTDPNTLSTTETNQSVVSLSITGDTDAAYWCAIEQASSMDVPAAPGYNDACWSSIRPVTQVLTSSGPRTLYLYTKTAGNIIGLIPAVSSIINSNFPPDQPTLVIKDPITKNTAVARQSLVQTDITDNFVTRWCVSEQQNSKPDLGTSNCAGGNGPANGWYLSRPSQMLLSAGDGQKIVYLWVANKYNNVSSGAVSRTINVDSVKPSTPIVYLSEPGTGSSESTVSDIVNITINDGNQATPVSWCVITQDSSFVSPDEPTFDSTCWKPKPSTVRVFNYGDKTVYVFAMSASGNISAPGSANIHYGPPPPPQAYLDLRDVNQYVSYHWATNRLVGVTVGSDLTITHWCLSETQTTRPTSQEEDCIGGQGEAKGWFTARPSNFTLSNGDDLKTVYLWVADANLQVNASPITFSITLDTQAPPQPVITLSDVNTGSTTETNRRQINLSVTNDDDAYNWCVVEQAADSALPEVSLGAWPYCWTGDRIRPTSVSINSTQSSNRMVAVYTRDYAGNISVPAIATIQFVNNAPPTPNLYLSDPVTHNETYVRTRDIHVDVQNDATAVKWCLSETQIEVPASGSAICKDGFGPAETNGWFTEEPTLITLPVGATEQHTIYVWVADNQDNVSLDLRQDYILYNPYVPGTPVISLSDPITGSHITTNQGIINISITNDYYNTYYNVQYYCLQDFDTLDPVPQQPQFDDSCFVNRYQYGKPSQVTLHGVGQRQVYLWTMSPAMVVSASPGTASIYLESTSPTPPEFQLAGASGGSNSEISRGENTSVYIYESSAVKWCLSEYQTTQPESGSATCEGGQGGNNGWYDSKPGSFALSAGDGEKVVYLWIADQFGNTNSVTKTYTITRVTPIYPDEPVVSFVENGVVSYNVTENPATIEIVNDENATAWCIVEVSGYSGAPYIYDNDPCWTTSRPTTWTFTVAHENRTVYVWLRSATGDRSSPGWVYVNWDKPAPVNPTLSLKDPISGSLTLSNSVNVKAAIGNDNEATSWCLSETQSVQPADVNSQCGGGQGTRFGWFTTKPSYIQLSAGSGLKTVYLWVADKYGYVNSGTVSASINVGSSSLSTPAISVVDRITGLTSTSTGQVSATITPVSGASSYCLIYQMADVGTPVAPYSNDLCWKPETSYNIDLLQQGAYDFFVYAKASGNENSNLPGKATVQFGISDASFITSSVIAENTTSNYVSAPFQINSTLAPSYVYKNANRSSDCFTDSDLIYQYSPIMTNSSTLTNEFPNLLDGDSFLCVVPVLDPEAPVNLAKARYYHWDKQPTWAEKAFLKTPLEWQGGHYGSKVAIWKDKLIVSDPETINQNYSYFRGAVYIYQISSTNQISMLARISYNNYSYYSQQGFGTNIAVNKNGMLAVGSPGAGVVYFYDLKNITNSNFVNSGYVLPGYNINIPGDYGTFGQGEMAFDPVNPDLLAVGYPGAYLSQNNGSPKGGVILFRLTNDSSNPVVVDSFYTSSNSEDDDAGIGTSVDIYDRVIVAGAPNKMTKIDDGTVRVGGVFVFKVPADTSAFRFESSNVLQGSVVPSRNYTFGKVVRIFNDKLSGKQYILAGDPDDNEKVNSAGAVWVWQRDIDGEWGVAPRKLFSSDLKTQTSNANFGGAIAVSGNHIVIGAPGTTGTNSVATVWSFDSDFIEKTSLSSSIARYSDGGFGMSVATSPEYIMIGSPLDTTINPVDTGILTQAPQLGVDTTVGGVSIYSGYRH